MLKKIINKIKNNFNRVIWCYDFLLIFGNKIKQSVQMLNKAKSTIAY
jgi:hypothetical protein